MPSVTIDAGVLAVPNEHGSADDADRYVKTLLDWRTLLDEPWVAVYMSDGRRKRSSKMVSYRCGTSSSAYSLPTGSWNTTSILSRK